MSDADVTDIDHGATPPGRPSPRALSLSLPIDHLSRLAGLTALVSAVLAIAGVLATIAYLSAWAIPAPLVRLDPLTAALRSEVVLYQTALLVLMLLVLESGARRLAGHPVLARTLFVALVAIIAVLGYQALLGGYEASFVTLGTAILIWAGHRYGSVGDRGVALACALAILLGAYVAGFESGVLIRDSAQYRTPVILATRSPVGGLAGSALDGVGWRYDGLYLVFRDGETVYVSQPGAGRKVWLVPAANVASIAVGSPED